MAKVKYIKSVSGNYFEIGINLDGSTYLRNNYTEVPNEFGFYDTERVRKLFDILGQQISNAQPVEFTNSSEHPNSCIRVLFDDGKVQLFKGNFCSSTTNAATYNEFWGHSIFSYSEMITLNRLRQVVREKREYKEVFLKAVEDIEIAGDDYMWMDTRKNEDGSFEMDKYTYGQLSSKGFISVDKDGYIVNTGDLQYTELLKKNGVMII